MRVPNGPLLALISVKKRATRGFEPWSARWEGRELPLSYNMISIPLVYVIYLINILMVHHPHLNLQNKKRCTHGIRTLVPSGHNKWAALFGFNQREKRATEGI
jgi:hypothetical protein